VPARDAHGCRSHAAPPRLAKHDDGEKALGVKIEEKFSVGEYDILVLSAEQSDGLQTWLTENGYKIPKDAGPVLASYIKQNVKFFVAKVNLDRHEAEGFTYLRPLRIEFKSPKFMLPIRSARSTPLARRNSSSTPSRAKAASRRRTTARQTPK